MELTELINNLTGKTIKLECYGIEYKEGYKQGILDLAKAIQEKEDLSKFME